MLRADDSNIIVSTAYVPTSRATHNHDTSYSRISSDSRTINASTSTSCTAKKYRYNLKSNYFPSKKRNLFWQLHSNRAKTEIQHENPNWNNISMQTSSKMEEQSNFWYTQSKKISNNNYDLSLSSSLEEIPVHPYLDNNGPLPIGCHRFLGCQQQQSSQDRIKRCILTTRVTPNSKQDDLPTMVHNAQNLIEAGFDSFLVDYNTNLEASFYASFIASTPPSIMRQCTLATTLSLQSATTAINHTGNNNEEQHPLRLDGSSIRNEVTKLISSMHSSSSSISSVKALFTDRTVLDNLILRHEPQSETGLVLEILDALKDLKREGLVRSIGLDNFPIELLMEAQNYGLLFGNDDDKEGNDKDNCLVESITVHGNILDPSNFVQHELDMRRNGLAQSSLSSSSNTNYMTIMSGVLAGGLLTDPYSSMPIGAPLHSQINYNNMKQNSIISHVPSLNKWASIHRHRKLSQTKQQNQRHLSKRTMISNNNWIRCQSILMNKLSYIAAKYETTVSSVALRWALQTCGGAVVSSSLTTTTPTTTQNYHSGDNSVYERAKDFRNVFRFELDDDDLHEIWALSGTPDAITYNNDSDEEDIYLDDLHNKKLWL